MGIKSIRKRGGYQESFVWLGFYFYLFFLLLLLFCFVFSRGVEGGESASSCSFVSLFLLVCCFRCYSAVAVIMGNL